jgi:hypothetical protein
MATNKFIDTSTEQKIAAASNVFIKCADCMHFQNSAHPSKKVICKELGVQKFANAPVCFTPNVYSLKKLDSTAFSQLASLVSTFSASDSRIFVGLLRQQTKLQRAGFTFLEKVYLKIGSNHLSNYFGAYCMGVGPDGEILLVGSDYLKQSKSSVVVQALPSSLIDGKEFQKIKTTLIAQGKISPEVKLRETISAHIEYEPPTFETSPEALEALSKRVKRTKNNPVKVLEVNLSELV